MKKLIILLSLALSTLTIDAQMDCSSTLSSRQADPPYVFNNLSRCMPCVTGKKYEYNVSLAPGKEYRFSFYASSYLNNRMTFLIIDTITGKKLLDLPGETKDNKKGETALKEYYDVVSERLVHPFFLFNPKDTMNLKIVIEIPEYKYKIKVLDPDPDKEPTFEEFTEKRRGCVTVFIQDMVSDEIGCNW